MLNYIKTVTCPICGCTEIIKEYVEATIYQNPEVNQHTNGTRWEHREFLCGYKVEYIPNFLREFTSENSQCFYDPEVIKRKQKEKEDKENLVSLLEKHNISPTLIERVKMHCLY